MQKLRHMSELFCFLPPAYQRNKGRPFAGAALVLFQMAGCEEKRLSPATAPASKTTIVRSR
jgi:hypothetical protein